MLNGSPLFTGGAGSGESEIRRHLLENDLVEAIVALPTDMFFNTGIATYVWIVTNRKPQARKDQVQLIDGSGFGGKMRKSLGSKRKALSDEAIDDLARLFGRFETAEIATVLDAAATVTNSTFVHNGASYGGQLSALDTYGGGTNSIDARNSTFTGGYSDNDGSLAVATAGNAITIENSAAFASGSGASDCAAEDAKSGRSAGSITTSSFYTSGSSDPQCSTPYWGIANLGTGSGRNLATTATSFGRTLMVSLMKDSARSWTAILKGISG